MSPQRWIPQLSTRQRPAPTSSKWATRQSSERKSLLSSAALSAVAFAAVLLGARFAAAQPTWTFHGEVMEGGQIDVKPGPSGVIHAVSTRYYQFDSGGSVLVDEDVGDGRQGALDFPPALDIASDSTVHLVTRHGGDFNSGHDIRYRRRNDAGVWDRDYLVGSPVKRNYVVGVSAPTTGDVYLMVSHGGTDVWGDLEIWEAGASSASLLGALSGIWRGDTDARMGHSGDEVVLVSGKCDPDGRVYFLHGAAGGGVVAALDGSAQEHVAGTGRRSFPDRYVDPTGQVHVTYGAYHEVYYNQYTPDGQRVYGSDALLFGALGDWHLSAGLSAVAASDDGVAVLAVGLVSDGSQSASDSDLHWSYSLDGGATWSAGQDLGVNTDGGEGRRRPRLVSLGRTFYLFYRDNAGSGIHLATVTLETDADSDGYPSDVDCDDTDPDVHPDADELCNGVDDNCDGQTDEGCVCTPGDGRPCGTSEGLCEEGTETCEGGLWSDCQGGVQPAPEICDGLDNDCDGDTDEDCATGDGGLLPDGGSSSGDGATNGDGALAGDGSTLSGDDSLSGGCGCRVVGALAARGRSGARNRTRTQTRHTSPNPPWFWLLPLLVMGLLARACPRRRSQPPHSSSQTPREKSARHG